MKHKKFLHLIGSFIISFMLTGCCMSHEWKEATCSEPKTCTKCGETEGEALGHTWVDATCAEAKHCSVCGETEGEPLEHTLTEANYQQPATCEICGETVGEPLQAYYEENGFVCDAQLNTAYPYTVPCKNNSNYTTTGTVTVSDYDVFSLDETHEALEGYEWQAFTITYFFDDENAWNYGMHGFGFYIDDYYVDYDCDEWDENFTLNYYGVDYTECMYESPETLQEGWIDDVYTMQVRLYVRCPEGYDGWVLCFETNPENDDSPYRDDTLFYRFKQ